MLLKQDNRPKMESRMLSSMSPNQDLITVPVLPEMES